MCWVSWSMVNSCCIYTCRKTLLDLYCLLFLWIAVFYVRMYVYVNYWGGDQTVKVRSLDLQGSAEVIDMATSLVQVLPSLLIIYYEQIAQTTSQLYIAKGEARQSLSYVPAVALIPGVSPHPIKTDYVAVYVDLTHTLLRGPNSHKVIELVNDVHCSWIYVQENAACRLLTCLHASFTAILSLLQEHEQTTCGHQLRIHILYSYGRIDTQRTHPEWNPTQTMPAWRWESVPSCWYLVRMYHFKYELSIIVTVAKLRSVCF